MTVRITNKQIKHPESKQKKRGSGKSIKRDVGQEQNTRTSQKRLNSERMKMEDREEKAWRRNYENKLTN